MPEEQVCLECKFNLLNRESLGKSYVYNALIAFCKSKGYKVTPTASTGIAATVLDGGTTLHSAFWVPPDVNSETPPMVDAHKDYAQRIRETRCIIVDEISMLNREVLEYIDRLLQDVCRNARQFGGKIVLIGNCGKR